MTLIIPQRALETGEKELRTSFRSPMGGGGGVRGVMVRVAPGKGHAKLLRRPIQHIHPLEICSGSPDPTFQVAELPRSGSPDPTSQDAELAPTSDNDERGSDGEDIARPIRTQVRPARRAANQARDRIVGCLIEDQC